MEYSFWFKHPRNFDNEYIVGVATTDGDAEQYAAEGFSNIDRDFALRQMSLHAPEGGQLFATATYNGIEVSDRFMLARVIRTGRDTGDWT